MTFCSKGIREVLVKGTYCFFIASCTWAKVNPSLLLLNVSCVFLLRLFLPSASNEQLALSVTLSACPHHLGPSSHSGHLSVKASPQLKNSLITWLHKLKSVLGI